MSTHNHEIVTHSNLRNILATAGLLSPRCNGGGTGPDILVTEQDVVCEVKRHPTKPMQQEAWEQAVDRLRGEHTYHESVIMTATPTRNYNSSVAVRVYVQDSGHFPGYQTPTDTFTLPADVTRLNASLSIWAGQARKKQLTVAAVRTEMRRAQDAELDTRFLAVGFILFNLPYQFIPTTKRVTFVGSASKRASNFDCDVELNTNAATLTHYDGLRKKYGKPATTTIDQIRGALAVEYSRYIPVESAQSQGEFYTPDSVRHLLNESVMNRHTPQSEVVVADLAAGCGSFIFDYGKEGYHVYGYDLDGDAVSILDMMGAQHIEKKNSLKVAGSRAYFGLPKTAPLIVVGNPPWKGSKSNQHSGKVRDTAAMEIDPKLTGRDLAIKFVKAAAHLAPQEIIYVLPFSLLQKESLYKQVTNLPHPYRPEVVAAFSNKIFHGTSTANEFPVCIVRFVRSERALRWEDFRKVKFPYYGLQRNDRGEWQLDRVNIQTVCLSGFKTTQHQISESPTKRVSPLGLYAFTPRALPAITSGSFRIYTTPGRSTIPVTEDNLADYAYLFMIKNLWRKMPEHLLDPLFNMERPIIAKDLFRGELAHLCVEYLFAKDWDRVSPARAAVQPWLIRQGSKVRLSDWSNPAARQIAVALYEHKLLNHLKTAKRQTVLRLTR